MGAVPIEHGQGAPQCAAFAVYAYLRETMQGLRSMGTVPIDHLEAGSGEIGEKPSGKHGQ
jgi:hypothetical protein